MIKTIYIILTSLILVNCSSPNGTDEFRNTITSTFFTDDSNVTYSVNKTYLPPNINIDIGFYNSDPSFIDSSKILDENENIVYTKMKLNSNLSLHRLYVPDGNLTYGKNYTLQIDNQKDIHFGITAIKLEKYVVGLIQGKTTEVNIESLFLDSNVSVNVFDEIIVDTSSIRKKANILASVSGKTIKITSNNDDILSDIILDSVQMYVTYQDKMYRASIAVIITPKNRIIKGL